MLNSIYKELNKCLNLIFEFADSHNIDRNCFIDYLVTNYKEQAKMGLFDDRSNESNSVKCKECEYLEITGCYGECSKAYKGIVSPNDSCGRGKLKERKIDEKV